MEQALGLRRTLPLWMLALTISGLGRAANDSSNRTVTLTIIRSLEH